MPIEEYNAIIKPQEIFKTLQEGYDVLMINKNKRLAGRDMLCCYNLRDLAYKEIEECIEESSQSINLTTGKIFIRTRREN